AIFALHPLMVESTAWVTERKNVLSMFFFLAAILSYGRFAGYWKDSHAAPRRGSFALAWFLFVGALLSKITAFALPAVILLLCWWKRGRIRWKEDVLPILPFFAVSVGLGLWITWLEKHHVGAQGADWNLNWMERILVAGRVPWFYAGKLLWPFHLCFVYPKWPLDTGAMWQWLFPVAAVAALVIPWLLRNRIGRGMAAAAFYFFGTLFPVLGFLNFYWTLFSYVGDHLVYLSSLGVLVPVAAMVATMANRWRKPALQYGFAILFLPLLAALTWREAGQYRNAATMWRSTISKNPACWLAYNNLASDFLQTKGHADEAQVLCEKSVSMKPDFPEAHYNLGVVHHQMGRTEEEIAEYETALKFSPAFANAHLNLGEALARKGRSDDAMSHYQKVMALKPSEPEAHYNMGNLLIEKGEVDQAIAAYQQALIIKPDYVLAHNNLGNSLLRKKEVGEAIAHFETAAQIDPGYVMAHQNLGSIYLKLGRYREAIDHCEKAVKIDPSDLGTLSNLAWLLATAPEPSLRDGPRALELARHASELSGGNHPTVLHTLAAAYAEDNRFDEAAQTAERALSLATAQGNNTLAEVIRNERTLYLAGQPVRAK
ncbi:MAG TPA: tetratricopeptide repeat protein, partial [Verrucomicrobiaceae bacterium]